MAVLYFVAEIFDMEICWREYDENLLVISLLVVLFSCHTTICVKGIK